MSRLTETRNKLRAAHDILSDSTTTRGKLAALTTLLTGIHPRTDALLAECNKCLTTLTKLEQGDVVHLSADMLPENTEEEKKRKKALLFFIKNWKDLKSEVERIGNELESGQSGTATQQTSMWGRIFAFSKGPFVLVGLIAVGLVALSTTAVSITIANEGCDALDLGSVMPFSVPGLSLPKEPIASGDSDVARVPPLTVTVEATQTQIKLKAVGMSRTFAVSSNLEALTFDGTQLLGNTSVVRLADRKEHELRVWCR